MWGKVRTSWDRSAGMFVSFAVVAALLPMFIWGVMAPGSFKVITRADDAEALRIWLEPEVVVAKPGQVVRLAVVGEYETRNKLVPKVELRIQGESGVKIIAGGVKYPQPFFGRVKFGDISVGTERSGVFKVWVVEGSVNTTLPNLPVITGESTIYVN